MPDDSDGTPFYLETVLALTGFAAGSVDVIGFTRLGGIFASAMTGNLALLGLYAAQGAANSAIGSLIALLGFTAGAAMGTLLTRNKSRRAALVVLLGTEAGLLLCAVSLWFLAPLANGTPRADGLIALLAVSMGLQIIAGKRINLSNIPTIVFTSTVTNIVTGITETFADKKLIIRKDNRRQIASVLMYFLGGFLAGLLVYVHFKALIVLPLIPVILALLIQIFIKRELSEFGK